MTSRFGRQIGSFRVRLVAYFVLLALLPLVTALWAYSQVAARNETANADTRINTALRAASVAYADRLGVASSSARSLAQATGSLRTLPGPDRAALLTLYANAPNAVYEDGGQVVVGQPPTGLAVFRAARVVDSEGAVLGRVRVFVPLDDELLTDLRSRSGVEPDDLLILTSEGSVIAGARVEGSLGVPVFEPDDVELAGRDYRGASVALPETQAVELAVLVPQAKIDAAAADPGRRVILFSVLALAIVALVAYFLGRGIVRALAELANAVAAISHENFTSRVPVRGRDEFARLGSAFNEMAAQLEKRQLELVEERGRTRDALTRFGEALAASTDRLQLLPVIVESIVEATGAAGGRILADGGELARAGRPDPTKRELEIPLGDVTAEAGLLLLTPSGTDFSNDARELAHYLGSRAWKALESARLHGRLKHEVVTDGLTELPNRRGFQQALDTELVRAKRLNGTVGLIMADLDDFKQVNDRYGHLTGDDVLCTFADVLRETVREIDVAARYGGEEFAVVLPATDLDEAELVAERLRAEMAARTVYAPGDVALNVTASFGVAAYPEVVGEAELVAAADAALYDAKGAGKNCVRVAAARPAVRPNA